MNQVKYYFSTTEDGNLSYLVDDLKQNVDKNRQTVANIMEYKNEDLSANPLGAICLYLLNNTALRSFKSTPQQQMEPQFLG